MSARKWLQWHSLYSHVAAPIWTRIPEKHRWRVVDWLNKSRRRCWSELVSDALTQREADACDTHVPALRGEPNLRCASVCGWMHPDHSGQHACSCYCGKFQFRTDSGSVDRADRVASGEQP